ncbi:MAG: FAD:protein FMN transferase [Lachnospiraceae bacterium]|nr:FAD:protein FMN transferase [Lachnospiraceae bacterium]
MRKGKFLPLLLAAALLLSACGNGGSSGESASTASESSGSAEASAAETAAAETSTAETAAAEASAAGEVASATDEVFAMDTYMTVTCYGDQCEEAVAAAIAEIERLDALLSVGEEDSEVALINANGSGTLSEDTLIMVQESLELWETTGGAFDITIYPLMELWGFTTGDFAVPDEEELQAMLALSGSENLTLDEESGLLTVGSGQGIDLGGIAKGYTSGRIMEIFEEYGIVSGMVSLGGNVQCYKTKTDGSLWRVGIQNPLEADDSSSFVGIVSVADQAVITSGGYERYFVDEETGETYHHILDPDTGYPAESGLISVTVVSDNGMLADGLSTACFVMGLEESTSYWQEYGEAFDLILMTEEGDVYVTEGIADSFTSDFTVNLIERED